MDRAAAELRRSLPRLPAAVMPATVILATSNAPQLAALDLDTQALGHEGYLIREVRIGKRAVILVTGNSDIAVL
ncbi:alpha-glucuronidase family glycosyl hydrolase, partial [Proteus mirabilis]|uniref:alpha-glucuronidase family glycosyl hydrolase n=1 Tax=Proteus mirabilis TaxID=584 RepID=UPI001C897555